MGGGYDEGMCMVAYQDFVFLSSVVIFLFNPNVLFAHKQSSAAYFQLYIFI